MGSGCSTPAGSERNGRMKAVTLVGVVKGKTGANLATPKGLWSRDGKIKKKKRTDKELVHAYHLAELKIDIPSVPPQVHSLKQSLTNDVILLKLLQVLIDAAEIDVIPWDLKFVLFIQK